MGFHFWLVLYYYIVNVILLSFFVAIEMGKNIAQSFWNSSREIEEKRKEIEFSIELFFLRVYSKHLIEFAEL